MACRYATWNHDKAVADPVRVVVLSRHHRLRSLLRLFSVPFFVIIRCEHADPAAQISNTRQHQTGQCRSRRTSFNTRETSNRDGQWWYGNATNRSTTTSDVSHYNRYKCFYHGMNPYCDLTLGTGHSDTLLSASRRHCTT
jgi:hypothetical protein